MMTCIYQQPTDRTRFVMLIVLAMLIVSCTGQSVPEKIDHPSSSPRQRTGVKTIFPQIHTNLNGMVSEFVRTMYQDSKGNYWFGTNGNGIIRYNGDTLEKITLAPHQQWMAVRGIVEDNRGHIWFGTSSGLINYDGDRFTTYAEEAGLQNEEIWGMTIDRAGLIWVGTLDGVSRFDGKTFFPFPLPESMVEDPQHMLSEDVVKQFLEDQHGTMWMVMDGNGIFTWKDGEFHHLTVKNGLPGNHVADILEDRQGDIWIGTYYNGVSRFDGQTFTHFTRDGIIEGDEIYNFCEDNQGNIWFSAENHGVYRYDGTRFNQFTTANGLTTNGVQSILADRKGQIWFGSWQGISIYDGQHITNASDREVWTK